MTYTMPGKIFSAFIVELVRRKDVLEAVGVRFGMHEVSKGL